MKSRDYRKLRQIELVRFAIRKFGVSRWRVKLSVELDVHRNEMNRWFLDDKAGNIQDRVEDWAEKQGFVSVYGAQLDQFKFHTLIVHQIMEQAVARNVAMGRAKRMTGAGLPFNDSELFQAFAGLGLDLKPQQ